MMIAYIKRVIAWLCFTISVVNLSTIAIMVGVGEYKQTPLYVELGIWLFLSVGLMVWYQWKDM